MPIYKVVVTTKEPMPAAGPQQFIEETRLVEAKSTAQALAHAADKHIVVTKASPSDLIACTKAGIEVEHAS